MRSLLVSEQICSKVSAKICDWVFLSLICPDDTDIYKKVQKHLSASPRVALSNSGNSHVLQPLCMYKNGSNGGMEVWLISRGGFHSHSSQGCNSKEKHSSLTHSLTHISIYSQQGRAGSAAGAGFGMWERRIAWKAKEDDHIDQLKQNRHIKMDKHTQTHSHIHLIWLTTRLVLSLSLVNSLSWEN